MSRNNNNSVIVPILIVVALVLVVGVGLWKVFGPSDQQPGTTLTPTTAAQPNSPAPAPKGTVAISIASSNTKEDWLHQVTAAFNERAKTDANFQVGGKPVFVEIVQEKVDGKMKDYRSGTMVSDTLSGKIKPTIISPGEMTWVDKISKEWKLANNAPIIRSDCPEVVRTPIVIAMWQSRARALGAWPEAGPNGSWGKIRELAVSPEGWGLYGHKEWGKFKIGYGYFGQSNSGTLGTVLMAMVAGNKTGKKNLEIGDISADNAVGKFINGVEKAKVHSGKSDVWLLEQMIGGGPEYLDAVVTYESNVIQMNQKHSGEMREPLVCVYPQDGTLIVAHPLAILDGAPWVTPEQAEAANVYKQYLLAREQQEAVLVLGLRPADPASKLASPIEPAYGANPTAKLVALTLPDQIVIDKIGEVWHRVKKHAVIAMLFDKSGSMQGEKMTAAIKGATEMVNAVDSEDVIRWMPFDDTVYGVVKEGTKAEIGETLVQSYVSTTVASGGTSLYDALVDAHEKIEAIRKQFGNSVRYGIVILSDGKDENSKKYGFSDIEARLMRNENDPDGTQVFTIAIGSNAEISVLQAIAKWGHGKFYKGNTAAEMVKIYSDIAAHY